MLLEKERNHSKSECPRRIRSTTVRGNVSERRKKKQKPETRKEKKKNENKPWMSNSNEAYKGRRAEERNSRENEEKSKLKENTRKMRDAQMEAPLVFQ